MKIIKKLTLVSLLCGFAVQEIKPMVALSKLSPQKSVAFVAGAALVSILGYAAYSWWTKPKGPDTDATNTVKVKKAKPARGIVGCVEEEKEPDLASSTFAFKDRAAWAEACKSVPKNIEASVAGVRRNAFVQKRQGVADFKIALTKFYELMASGPLQDASMWTDSVKPDDGFYDVKNYEHFQPYVQRLDLNSGDEVVFHGDFHGDIHSFIKELDDLEEKGYLQPGSFKLAKDNVYLVFLGDYVDRGFYGSEVIYTLLRLKLANPDKVIMVRGNHEDASFSDMYGFAAELSSKFSTLLRKEQVYRLYEFLPVALYLGSGDNYLQCCHGGLEHGYNPGKLLSQGGVAFDLLGEVKRARICSCKEVNDLMPDDELGLAKRSETPSCCASMKTGFSIGFLWHDFVKLGDSLWNPGRGLAANEDLTKAVLDFQNQDVHAMGSIKQIRGIFRAHQHSGGMDYDNPTNLMSELVESNGVYKLWRPIESDEERSLIDGLVWTFNVSPDSGYGQVHGYGFDAYAILQIAEAYEDWKLCVHTTMVIPEQDVVREPGYVVVP